MASANIQGSSASIVDNASIQDWLRVIDKYADDTKPLLDTIDARAGGSSGATEKLHELADANKFVVNKIRELLSAGVIV